MASRPRRIPLEEMELCSVGGKVRYTTKQQAYRQAQAMRGPRGRGMMDVYKCKWCKGYHLTHHTSKKI